MSSLVFCIFLRCFVSSVLFYIFCGVLCLLQCFLWCFVGFHGFLHLLLWRLFFVVSSVPFVFCSIFSVMFVSSMVSYVIFSVLFSCGILHPLWCLLLSMVSLNLQSLFYCISCFIRCLMSMAFLCLLWHLMFSVVSLTISSAVPLFSMMFFYAFFDVSSMVSYVFCGIVCLLWCFMSGLWCLMHPKWCHVRFVMCGVCCQVFATHHGGVTGNSRGGSIDEGFL